MSSSSSDDRPEAHLVYAGAAERGYLMLPYTREEFKDFVSSLLGRPQAITTSKLGEFAVRPQDIWQLHQLIDQRVRQQNDASLALFSALISYNDGSSVELNALEELLTYNEVRPVIAVALNVRWDWLVQFPGHSSPTKQAIDVSFLASHVRMNEDASDFLYTQFDYPFAERRVGRVRYRIEYTARTWGADIQGLIAAHLAGLMKSPHPFRALCARFRIPITAVIAGSMLIGIGVASILSDSRYRAAQSSRVSNALDAIKGSDLGAVTSRITLLVKTLVTSGFPGHEVFYIGLLSGIILSFVTMVALISFLPLSLPSFILFSSFDERDKQRVERAYRRSWWSVILATALSLASGWVSNFIFKWTIG